MFKVFYKLYYTRSKFLATRFCFTILKLSTDIAFAIPIVTANPIDTIFFIFSGETYKLETPEDKAYNLAWILTTGFTWTYLYIEACSDAHLAMAAIPGQIELVFILKKRHDFVQIDFYIRKN